MFTILRESLVGAGALLDITEGNTDEHTIAIDCAMSTWLLSITLDLFTATLIACARHTPPLLHGLRLRCLIVTDVITG